jgi:hypothetical protein
MCVDDTAQSRCLAGLDDAMKLDTRSVRPMSNLLCACEKDMGTVCDGHKCTAQAAMILIVHQMDECDVSYAQRWTPTPHGTGNRVFLLCERCTKRISKNVDDKVKRMREATIAKGAMWLECTTCGRRIDDFADACKVEALINA